MDPDTASEVVNHFRNSDWHAQKIDIETEEEYLVRSAVKITPMKTLTDGDSIRIPSGIKKLIGEISVDFKDEISLVTEEEDGKITIAFVLDDGEVVDTRPKAEQERAERLIEAVENQYPNYTIGSRFNNPEKHRLIPHYTHLGDIITATTDELMQINRIGEKRAGNLVDKHSQEVKQAVRSGIEKGRFLIEGVDGTLRFPEEYHNNDELEPRVPMLKPEDINPEGENGSRK